VNHDPAKVLAALERVFKELKRDHAVGSDVPVIRVSHLLEMIQAAKDNPDNSGEINPKGPNFPLDTLIAVCEKGPLFDGDVPSKRERDVLLEHGYIAKVSVNGEQGYNAATYKGNHLYCRYYGASTMKEAHATRIARRVMRDASGDPDWNKFKLRDLIIHRPGSLRVFDDNRPNNGVGNFWEITRVDSSLASGTIFLYSPDRVIAWQVDGNEPARLDSTGEVSVIDLSFKTIRLVFRMLGEKHVAPDTHEFRQVINGRKTWENNT
jgi:hypothetical protein